MQRSALAIALILGLIISWTPPALAWNKAGHMVSGAIAYEVLKERDPSAVAKVIALLKQHPFYKNPPAGKKAWIDIVSKQPPEERDRDLFMLAARCPDDARGTNFHRRRGRWHFVNLPYKPTLFGSRTRDHVMPLRSYARRIA